MMLACRLKNTSITNRQGSDFAVQAKKFAEPAGCPDMAVAAQASL
ncbi:hypothetical protein [Marinobacterium rhizophilum]|nr:hypothetical protein [Marinobacterium rhizophilum]